MNHPTPVSLVTDQTPLSAAPVALEQALEQSHEVKARDGDALIQNADAAMYRAKKIECGYAVHEVQPERHDSRSDGTG